MNNKGLDEGRVSWPAEMAGAAVAGVVVVVYAISHAALLFPAPLDALLPLGMGLTLVSGCLGALWLSARSQLPFALAGTDANTTSILAGMAATLSGAGAAALAPQHVLWLLAVTTALCALLFLVLGVGRLGLAVRYVPYPVVGGFLASTGWLICAGALRVVSPLPPLDAPLSSFLKPPVMAACAIAVALLLVLRRQRHPVMLPGLLVVAALAVLAGLKVAGIDTAQARAQGWLFDVSAANWVPVLGMGPREIPWAWIAGQWPDMLAVAAIAVITVLLGASGLEVMSRRDISLDKELREHGLLNLATGMLGGYLSLVSVSRSAVLMDSGVRTRTAGMACALVCLAALAGGSWLLAAIPKPVLAGFLLYLGLAILREWVIDVRRRMGLADWFLIVVILGITATIGIGVALLAGIVVSCLNFALSYSRVGVVQHDVDGSAMRSSVQRPAAHRALLSRDGARIRVLVLRGVIFFGTANALLERVRAFLQPADGTRGRRVLVLDFSQAASADSSAALTFSKLSQLAAAAGVRLVACGLGAGTRHAVEDGMQQARIAQTLDDALEIAEEELLRSEGLDPLEAHEAISAWLERELGAARHARVLQPFLERREVAPGDSLIRQGDASDLTLYMIERGRFSVSLDGLAQGRRIATLLAGNVAGEMALYEDARRSATVTAEVPGVVWALRRSVLEALHQQAPDTAMRVHAFLVRTLAERVKQANAAAAALQRGA